jgi:hypothetical protein
MIYLAAAFAFTSLLAFAGWVMYLRTTVGATATAKSLEALYGRLDELSRLSAQTDAKVNRFAASAKSLADTTETVSLLALRAGLRGSEKPRV